MFQWLPFVQVDVSPASACTSLAENLFRFSPFFYLRLTLLLCRDFALDYRPAQPSETTLELSIESAALIARLRGPGQFLAVELVLHLLPYKRHGRYLTTTLRLLVEIVLTVKTTLEAFRSKAEDLQSTATLI